MIAFAILAAGKQACIPAAASIPAAPTISFAPIRPVFSPLMGAGASRAIEEAEPK